MWVLHTKQCAVCGKQFDWMGLDDEDPPESCSEECDKAAVAAKLCVRCKRKPHKWRKLCLSCFRYMQSKALKGGGWGPIVAAGLAGERAAGHGNPESRPCSEAGCGRVARSLGLCHMHYRRKKRKESRQCQS